jgi:arginine exporter protein ArgO
MTILSFVAIFAGLRLGETNGSYFSAAAMVLGVFLGSALWWLGLSLGVGLLRDRFRPAWMIWVNRASGIIITSFGAAALLLK